MSPAFLQLTLVPMLIGILSAVSCALLGNFLVLRQQSMIGDAVSHVALPGIVVAFLVTSTLDAIPMLIGAAIAAIVTVGLIELIKKVGRVEPGAAIGVVFTAMFALGVLLLEQSDTSSVHLDVEHALYGNLESMVWFAGQSWRSLLDPVALAQLPPQLMRLVVVLAIILIFLLAAWKELQIGTFDPEFAQSIGAHPKLVNTLLIILVAVAAVTSFDAVGSIIVIAMFICPPATARLMTNNLRRQIIWSVVFATLSAVIGFILAGNSQIWMRAPSSVSAAGMIATVSGVFLLLGTLVGPRREGTRSAIYR